MKRYRDHVEEQVRKTLDSRFCFEIFLSATHLITGFELPQPNCFGVELPLVAEMFTETNRLTQVWRGRMNILRLSVCRSCRKMHRFDEISNPPESSVSHARSVR